VELEKPEEFKLLIYPSKNKDYRKGAQEVSRIICSHRPRLTRKQIYDSCLLRPLSSTAIVEVESMNVKRAIVHARGNASAVSVVWSALRLCHDWVCGAELLFR
jgi:hypothetical protein